MRAIIRFIGLAVLLAPTIAVMAAEPQRIDGEAGFGRNALAEGNLVVVADRQRSLHILAPNDDGEWQRTAELTPAEGEEQDDFGAFLAIDGNRLVAGAPAATVDGLQDAGAVYVFERDGDDGNWRQTARLVAEEPIASGGFGSGVGVDAGRIVVAAQSVTDAPDERQRVAHVYEYDAATLSWEQVATLSRDSAERFAISVDVSCDRVVVGTGEGFVFTYVRTDTGWPLSLPVRPTVTGNGLKVALEGDVLAVSAPYANIPDRPWSAGQVYIFERDDSTWEHVATFQAPAPRSNGGFGTRLDMNDGIVGAVGNHETSGTLSLIRKDESGEWVRFESLDCCFPGIGRTIAVSAQAIVTGGSDGGPGSVYIHDTASLLPEGDDGGEDDDSGSGDGGDAGNGDSVDDGAGDDTGDNSEGSAGNDDSGEVDDDAAGITDGGDDPEGDADGSNDDNAGNDGGGNDEAGTGEGAGEDVSATGSSGGGAFGWLMLLPSVLLLARRNGKVSGRAARILHR